MRILSCIALMAILFISYSECGETSGVDFNCCTPKAWTSNVRLSSTPINGLAVGGNALMESSHTYHYDSENQREAWTDVMQNGQKVYSKVIKDYKRHRWTTLVDPEHCTSQKLAGDFEPQCTPGSIDKVLFALTPELTPEEGMSTNTLYYDDAGIDVIGHMTVTVECALVEEASYQPTFPDPSVQTVKYFNQTLTVDPSVFEIPKNIKCPPPPLNDVSNSYIEAFSKLIPLRRSLPLI